MRRRLFWPTLILASLAMAYGCAPVIVAGGATAAVVANDRRTLGSFIDDETIELKSRKALNSDASLGENMHVNITSVNGVVLLTGETAAAEQRDRAIADVREVLGIRRIVNELRVAPISNLANRANDSWLTSKAKARLIATKDLDSGQIKVVTENSTVYLLGLVKKNEADIVTEAVRQVGGVRRVVKLFEYLD